MDDLGHVLSIRGRRAIGNRDARATLPNGLSLVVVDRASVDGVEPVGKAPGLLAWMNL
jgi:hypothetical protein